MTTPRLGSGEPTAAVAPAASGSTASTAPAWSLSARRRRRWGLGALLTLGAVVAIAVLSLSMRGSIGAGGIADPDTPGRGGARAIAQVLRQQGVQVDVVRSIDELEQTQVDRSTSIAIGGFDYLGAAAAERTMVHAQTAQRLVLLEPSDLALADLDVPLAVEARSLVRSEAGCTSSIADHGDRLDAAATFYRATVENGASGEPTLPQGATGCFRGQEASAALVILHAEGLQPETIVLGSRASILNATVAEASHAALALRALGASPRLVWYVPSISDLQALGPDGEPLPGDDRGVPEWFGPGVLLVAIAFVLFAVARGRRLGRVVAEPLPVVVRAVETTEARGRLYRRASDRERAASSLRAGTRSRLASRLGVPRQANTGVLVTAVARTTGRDPVEVAALLDGPIPQSDTALVLLAEQLAQLEENVRQP